MKSPGMWKYYTQSHSEPNHNLPITTSGKVKAKTRL